MMGRIICSFCQVTITSLLLLVFHFIFTFLDEYGGLIVTFTLHNDDNDERGYWGGVGSDFGNLEAHQRGNHDTGNERCTYGLTPMTSLPASTVCGYGTLNLSVLFLNFAYFQFIDAVY
jgi:hypothetical protein